MYIALTTVYVLQHVYLVSVSIKNFLSFSDNIPFLFIPLASSARFPISTFPPFLSLSPFFLDSYDAFYKEKSSEMGNTPNTNKNIFPFAHLIPITKSKAMDKSTIDYYLSFFFLNFQTRNYGKRFLFTLLLSEFPDSRPVFPPLWLAGPSFHSVGVGLGGASFPPALKWVGKGGEGSVRWSGKGKGVSVEKTRKRKRQACQIARKISMFLKIVFGAYPRN